MPDTSSSHVSGSPQFVPNVVDRSSSQAPQTTRFKDDSWADVSSQLWIANAQFTTIAGAAFCAKTLVAPLERVKILRQVRPMAQSPGAETARSTTLSSSLRKIVRTDGWKGLFRSHGANVTRLIPEVILKFAVHDQLRVICGASAADPTQISTTTRVAAASATGLLRTALLHPLSVIRTRLAADTGMRSVLSVETGSHAPAWPAVVSQQASPQRFYVGIWHCFTDTVGREGLSGLYRGSGLAAATTVPYLTICFGTYDALTKLLPTDKQSVGSWWFPLVKMGTGAGAGIIAQVVTYPLDTVRRRLEVNGSPLATMSYSGVWNCALTVSHKEGVASLYRGCLINSLKIAPSAALQFLAYDCFKTGLALLDPGTVAAARL